VVYTDLLQHIDVDSDGLEQRRRASAEDVECHKKSMRFSLRRSIIPGNVVTKSIHCDADENCGDASANNNDNDNNDASDDDDKDVDNKAKDTSSDKILPEVIEKESRDVANSNSDFIYRSSVGAFLTGHNNNDSISDLAGAFQVLAATRSPEEEGETFGSVTIRDDGSICGIERAKALEARVVELIAAIGEIVINSGASRPGSSFIRTDSVFEYFCEKSILSLLVDIAKEKRQTKDLSRRQSEIAPADSAVHGVV
ncbi:MAG: hypothetical protein SGILL_003489, partial [Bacillariaceae sp.]